MNSALNFGNHMGCGLGGANFNIKANIYHNDINTSFTVV